MASRFLDDRRVERRSWPAPTVRSTPIRAGRPAICRWPGTAVAGRRRATRPTAGAAGVRSRPAPGDAGHPAFGHLRGPLAGASGRSELRARPGRSPALLGASAPRPKAGRRSPPRETWFIIVATKFRSVGAAGRAYSRSVDLRVERLDALYSACRAAAARSTFGGRARSGTTTLGSAAPRPVASGPAAARGRSHPLPSRVSRSARRSAGQPIDDKRGEPASGMTCGATPACPTARLRHRPARGTVGPAPGLFRRPRLSGSSSAAVRRRRSRGRRFGQGRAPACLRRTRPPRGRRHFVGSRICRPPGGGRVTRRSTPGRRGPGAGTPRTGASAALLLASPPTGCWERVARARRGYGGRSLQAPSLALMWRLAPQRSLGGRLRPTGAATARARGFRSCRSKAVDRSSDLLAGAGLVPLGRSSGRSPDPDRFRNAQRGEQEGSCPSAKFDEVPRPWINLGRQDIGRRRRRNRCHHAKDGIRPATVVAPSRTAHRKPSSIGDGLGGMSPLGGVETGMTGLEPAKLVMRCVEARQSSSAALWPGEAAGSEACRPGHSHRCRVTPSPPGVARDLGVAGGRRTACDFAMPDPNGSAYPDPLRGGRRVRRDQRRLDQDKGALHPR